MFKVFFCLRHTAYLTVFGDWYEVKIKKSFLGIGYWTTVTKPHPIPWGPNIPIQFTSLDKANEYIEKYKSGIRHGTIKEEVTTR